MVSVMIAAGVRRSVCVGKSVLQLCQTALRIGIDLSADCILQKRAASCFVAAESGPRYREKKSVRHPFLISRRMFSANGCLFSEPKHSNLGSSGSPFAEPVSGASASVDEREKAFFRGESDKWWKPGGQFSSLHSMNELRVPLVRDSYLAYSSHGPSRPVDPAVPLSGVKILDVGCGGGILSEPLARLGGHVTGIDMVEENIANAQSHWLKTQSRHALRRHSLSPPPGSIRYLCSTVEDLALQEPGSYDVVVCSEVIEHVADVQSFVDGLGGLVKEGGVLVLTTPHRTVASFLALIWGAEYLLRDVPKGTHQWRKLIRPEELQRLLERRGLNIRLVHGWTFNPLMKTWHWTQGESVMYVMVAVKSGNAAGT